MDLIWVETGGGMARRHSVRISQKSKMFKFVFLIAQVSSLVAANNEVTSAATDDFSCLSRALSNLSISASKIQQQCRVALTDAIMEYCVLHWDIGVDPGGTPFFNQHMRFRSSMFESPWRRMINTANDCRPVLNLNLSKSVAGAAGNGEVYAVPVIVFGRSSLELVEMHCRTPPGVVWERPAVDAQAPAAGLVCNAGPPVRINIGWGSVEGEVDSMIIHMPKLMPAGSTIAELAAEARVLAETSESALDWRRVGAPAFEDDQRMLNYDTEKWLP